MRLFRRVGAIFQEAARQDFSDEHFESHLEDLLEQNPYLLGDLLIIGRQVRTERAERIDLVALDCEADVIIIELKRGPAHREIVSQINSYLTTARKWKYDDLERLAGAGVNSLERVLARRFKDHFKCETLPTFNRNQRGIIVAESIDAATIEDLGNLRSSITALEFSHFRGEGEEYLLLRAKAESLSAAAPGEDRRPQVPRKEKTRLRDYDDFLRQVADEVNKLLPPTLQGLKSTGGHWDNEQNRRFHWGGTDIHVGVHIEREGTGDTAWVYFCNYRRDPRVSELLKKNEVALRKALSLQDGELDLRDTRGPINQPLGAVSVDMAQSLVRPAAERAIKYLQALKPILGELL